MKRCQLMSVITLALLIVVTSFSVIETTAQTAAKSHFVLTDTTSRQAVMNALNVQITPDENAEKFILAVNNPLEEKLRITIAGPAGPGFSDLTKSSYYRKRISLDNAEDGEYTVRISSLTKTFTKIVSVNTATVQTRSINVK